MIGKFKKFVNRHDRLLKVLGATVVLAIFFLKDIYRDSLNGFVSAVGRAQESYSLKQSFTLLGTELSGIEALVKYNTNSGDLAYRRIMRDFTLIRYQSLPPPQKTISEESSAHWKESQ